jgi:hypothetical protein
MRSALSAFLLASFSDHALATWKLKLVDSPVSRASVSSCSSFSFFNFSIQQKCRQLEVAKLPSHNIYSLESIQLTPLYSEMSSAVISIRVGGRRSAILSFETKANALAAAAAHNVRNPLEKRFFSSRNCTSTMRRKHIHSE